MKMTFKQLAEIILAQPISEQEKNATMYYNVDDGIAVLSFDNLMESDHEGGINLYFDSIMAELPTIVVGEKSACIKY